MLKTVAELVKVARTNLNVIDVNTAKTLLSQTEGILLDVRESSELKDGSVLNAIHVPRGILEPTMLSKYPNPELPIFIYCASGARATFAAEQLVKLGYTDIYVIGDKYIQIKEVFE